jgi:8-oxo-dGTP pyrophosphatase MutT (NUDIX family)
VTDNPLSLAGIRRALAAHQPAVLPADRPHAAVALLLAEGASGPEALFILRSAHERDPWSGNIGFPGGRVTAGENDPRTTAEREAREELALVLSGCEYLGRLDDLYGLALPILVSCFVYAARVRPALTPNQEVARAFWYPVHELCRPERHRLETFPWRGQLTTQPVADLLGPGEPRLWGITYRLLRNLFDILELPFGLVAREPACP